METSIADLSRQRRIGAWLAALGSFNVPFMSSALNVALKAIDQEFHLGAVGLSWLSTSFILSSAVFLLPAGRLADIYGRKRFFVLGTLLFTVASLLAPFCPNGPTLILLRTVQGIGGAMVFGTAVAILTALTVPAERGRMLGYNVAAVYLGLSLGPFLGGILTQRLGWRSIFLVSALPGLGILWLVRRLRGEWRESRGERFDTGGALLYGTALVALMFGITRLPHWLGLVALALSLAAAVGFVRRERRAAAPLLRLELFRGRRIFLFSNLAALIHYCATFTVGFLLSLYLQHIKGLGAGQTGLVLLVQPVLQAMLSPLAGRLSDRRQPRLVASFGMLLTTLGLFFFVFLGPDTPIVWVAANLALQGVGFAFFSSPNTNAIMGAVERRHFGVAASLVATMRVIGQMLGMGVVTLLFTLFMGRARLVPEVYPFFLRSLAVGFALFTVLGGIGIFFSLARGEKMDSTVENSV